MKWPQIALVALVLGACGSPGAAAPSHDDAFSKEGLFKADVNDLRDTELVVHPDVPLDARNNVLWCGTLQLAWNKATELIGAKFLPIEKLRQGDAPRAGPHEVDLLNRQDFTTHDLDPASYVAVADFERNHVEDEIRAALQKTFGGSASPELIPPVPRNPGPNDFVAYAYLFKNLTFATPFADLGKMEFGGQPVESFGFNGEAHLPPAVLEQCSIRDYRSTNDFVVELATKAKEDQLILAKVPPAATLQATIRAVLARVGAKSEPVTNGDTMAVPKLNFDLRRDFRELEGMVLSPGPSAKIHPPLEITKAEQLVRFQLNEKGAILKSEAVIVMKALAMMPQHRLVFDQPFLILLKQKSSAQPYFALWVGNASLLVPAGS